MQGERHGQRRAKRQSGGKEAQEREDQDNCRGAEPEDRGVAAELWEEEIATLNGICALSVSLPYRSSAFERASRKGNRNEEDRRRTGALRMRARRACCWTRLPRDPGGERAARLLRCGAAQGQAGAGCNRRVACHLQGPAG